MILYFDENTLELNVRLGALNKYDPNDDIKEIVSGAEELKKLRDDFLNNVYNPKVKKLLDDVDRINLAENPQLALLREQNKKKTKE